MTKVFISYARDNGNGQKLAEEIQERLEISEFTVFRDVIGLKPGDLWYSKLESELESSNIMLLVISEKVRSSKWVHNEFNMAEEIGIPVIPITSEAVRSPLWIRHLQALSFENQYLWDELFDAISAKVGTISKQRDTENNVYQLAEDARPNWSSKNGSDRYGYYADLLLNGVTQRLRLIQNGSFWMGYSPEEVWKASEIRHRVSITKSFWISDTTCTQELWLAVMGSNPSHFDYSRSNPVENINWYDTKEFINRVDETLESANVKLPTEAQWEYACRAGTTTPFSFGKDITSEQVNYNGHFPYLENNKTTYREKTIPVKSLPPNPWGIYQMHGNVWEWVEDCWRENLSGDSVEDPHIQHPTGTKGNIKYVLRGGSWNNHARDCRSSTRYGNEPDNRHVDDSFRFIITT